jgi:site-specific DNA-cytosine methylase
VKILELFAGSKSFSNAAASHGHQVFTSDYDPAFDTHYCVDIFDFDYDKVPFIPDVIWASPPCESFSVASIGHHWNHDKTPKTKNAETGMNMILKTLEIIEYYNPKYYFIENPRGMMRKMPFMQHHPVRHTVTYCQYGDTRMKPTDIWTNHLDWTPRPACKNGQPCHVAAPRGSRTGTQGISTYYDRSKIPFELCNEIAMALSLPQTSPDVPSSVLG